MSERTYIIGDIHGCLEMLKRLMDKIGWQPESDRLIFLGDYIDRGKDSRGVVEFILQLLETSGNIRCLKGNHESLFLDYLDGVDSQTFLMNGGENTLASYAQNSLNGISLKHMSFYRSLETMVELDDYYVVHAGFRPGVDVSEQSEEDFLWIREPFLFSDYDFGKKVIFGHSPFYEPLIMDNKIGIDTGAVFGNKLTCLELPDMRFHSVE
jgi:serine/threonine protein phosphatase 1